jgi:predicted GTPase
MRQFSGQVVVNKIGAANPSAVNRVYHHVCAVNPDAPPLNAASPVCVAQPDAIRGKRIVVIEDGRDAWRFVAGGCSFVDKLRHCVKITTHRRIQNSIAAKPQAACRRVQLRRLFLF